MYTIESGISQIFSSAFVVPFWSERKIVNHLRGVFVLERRAPARPHCPVDEPLICRTEKDSDRETLKDALLETVACDFKTCLRGNWPEYLMEAAISLYLFFTCLFATLFQHPNSPIHEMMPSALVRRGLMGIAVAATVVVIALTPWGKQSGGHINPAMTFTFYRLGKVEFWDAVFYGVAQFGGAAAGVAIATYLLHGAPGNETARYAATLLGKCGSGVAFVAEATISFSLMLTVLFVSNHGLFARYTPYFIGALYALFITFETPLSGMSMNPARTFGPALQTRHWHAVWVYFLGPTLGMLVASEVFLWARKGIGPYCAKLHHANGKR